MPIEHVVTPYDLSSMQELTVPDLWPPADWAPVDRRPAAEPPDRRPGEAAGANGGQAGEAGDGGQAWARQFAVLLAEALTGDRPARQIRPWLSQRGRVHLHRLLPLFADGQRARVQRLMTTRPSPDVIEMTLIVAVGPRVRALAARLALDSSEQWPGWQEKRPTGPAPSRAARSARWLCTDIEAA
ncbi:MAG TPA: Rv3235 family protein [Trebonia sp.]|jgi:hypothetical protein|nr:Rv3235 family protein [Trebonia sp.]